MSVNKFTQKAHDARVYSAINYAFNFMTAEERQHCLDHWDEYDPKYEYTYGYDQAQMITLDADPELIVGGKIKFEKSDLVEPRWPTTEELPNGLSDEDWGTFKSILFQSDPHDED